MNTPSPRRVLVLGAAGRDFHDFNVAYRDDESVEVVAFTATQIPGVADRRYPAELAGPRYPDGIPIHAEDQLEELVARYDVDEVVFAYSDVPHEHVMHLASRSLAAGADFVLLGPERTQLSSTKPVVAVTAVRTGAGKSPISRWLSRHFRERGLRVAVIRHPMPYGTLQLEAVQRFAEPADLDAACCTIEEREEYEPHISFGNVVFAGVDYEAILRKAQEEADLIIWDGGNNDFSFLRPELSITVVDALRPDQLTSHHPGETVLRLADVVVVNKVDSADDAVVADLIDRVGAVNPTARIVKAASPVALDDPPAVAGRAVLVVEDGPTITHGGMPHGAGLVAARAAGAGRIVDPRSSAVPAIAAVYERYPHIGPVLPAMGYGAEQIAALSETIEGSDADVVVSGTPIDLAAVIETSKPIVRARYEFTDAGLPTLEHVVDDVVGHLFVEE
jgi:predicted GTPase